LAESPMNTRSEKPYAQLPAILFLFIQMLSLGVYSVFFLITFSTFEPEPFAARSALFYQSAQGILAIGGISMILLALLEFLRPRLSAKNVFLELPRGKEETRWYVIFLFGQLSILILKYAELDLHVLSFIVFLGTLVYIFHLAQTYTFEPHRPSWNNPTTAGGIIQGTAVLGISLALWVFRDQDLQRLLCIILFVILLLEVLTLWSRFRFLSRTNATTQNSVKMLLGSHLALFGVRFIFGLIMPLVYLVWLIFISQNIPFHLIILMVGVGELSERVLFFITSQALPNEGSN